MINFSSRVLVFTFDLLKERNPIHTTFVTAHCCNWSPYMTAANPPVYLISFKNYINKCIYRRVYVEWGEDRFVLSLYGSQIGSSVSLIDHLKNE